MLVCPVLQKRLDVRHPEEVFEVAGVRQGLLKAPRTVKKNLSCAPVSWGPDISVKPWQNLMSAKLA